MSVEYGANGLIGILTPQANTTVEPECSILLPPGQAMIAARLTSTQPSIDARLLDYLEAIDRTLEQFANAPVNAVGFACTGASYLAGVRREAEIVKRVGEQRNYPFVTAGDAIIDALAALDAKSVAIVSPYDDPLHQSGLDYWRARGLEIAGVTRLKGSGTSFHPIYGLGSDAALAGARQAAADDADAIVLLGTGLPTLAAILAMTDERLPILSSNLCLMWRTTLAASGQMPNAASLEPWLDGSCWKTRFDLQTRQSP